ncbi:MAG: hypothetical protein CL920_11180 [Deltaproteobacteria bacterium]|nr:hypothetical protein [Deltaproteobacteria bacterium]
MTEELKPLTPTQPDRAGFSPDLAPTFHTLSNGIRVALCPLPHLHSAGIGVYVRVGSRYESSRVLGVSHFLEHVLFRGNARYATSLDMNRAFEAWGGAINGYTTREFTYYFGKVHPDHLSDAIPFMGDFIHKPLFEGVDLERNIILEERLEDVDEDGQDLEIDDVSRAAFWGEHPLGHKIIGLPNTLRYVQQKQLEEHFAQFYTGEHLVICVTGRFASESVLPMIEQAFSHLPAGAPFAIEPAPTEAAPSQSTAFVSHDSSQVQLQLSFLGVSPQDPMFPSLLLLERVLDDGMSSRLWQRIVEEEGLCYEVWAGLDTYHDTSVLDIGASVAPEKTLKLAEKIVHELKTLRDEGPTEEEFALVKRRLRFSQEYALDQVEQLNERLGASVLYDAYVPFETQRAQIEALTMDEFVESTKKILCTKRALFAAVGPLSKSVKRRLREFARTF